MHSVHGSLEYSLIQLLTTFLGLVGYRLIFVLRLQDGGNGTHHLCGCDVLQAFRSRPRALPVATETGERVG